MATEKLIDANELKKKLRDVKEWFDGCPSTEQDKLAQAVVQMCIEEVNKIKPVEAVEVVRCKDCKHYYYSAYAMRCVCDFDNKEWDKDDFCSYGEKRAEEGK